MGSICLLLERLMNANNKLDSLTHTSSSKLQLGRETVLKTCQMPRSNGKAAQGATSTLD